MNDPWINSTAVHVIKSENPDTAFAIPDALEKQHPDSVSKCDFLMIRFVINKKRCCINFFQFLKMKVCSLSHRAYLLTTGGKKRHTPTEQPDVRIRLHSKQNASFLKKAV
jgi:hypothetical protein